MPSVPEQLPRGAHRALSAPRPRQKPRVSTAAAQPGLAEAPKPLHLPPDRYLDRERSWIQFNERVLELAEDESIPLLERVRFLAIFASNLDEFFMVRVAGLMRRMVAGFPVEGAGPQMPSQVLRSTLAAARTATGKHSEVFRTSSSRRWPRRASRSSAGAT